MTVQAVVHDAPHTHFRARCAVRCRLLNGFHYIERIGTRKPLDVHHTQVSITARKTNSEWQQRAAAMCRTESAPAVLPAASVADHLATDACVSVDTHGASAAMNRRFKNS